MNGTSGKRVFITGCSSGIGRATALAMLRSGYDVAATARDIRSLENIADEAGTFGGKLLRLYCDLSDTISIDSAAVKTLSEFGGLDILINNAGYAAVGPVELVSLDKARRQFEVNTFGAISLIQLFAASMRAQGGGKIISVSSIAGRMHVPMAGWYSASKQALEALHDALRFELGPDNIRVVSVLPGPVGSSFMQNLDVEGLPDYAPRLYEDYMQHYHLRRNNRPFMISPDEVAVQIVRIVKSRNPRPRYYMTAPAKLFSFARRLFSDRMWDYLTKKAYGFDRVDLQYVRSRRTS